MVTRLYAFVQDPAADEPVVHSQGLPPELTGNVDNRRLPRPDVLVLEADEQSAMLYRYTSNGEFGGDTWHETAEAAVEQAEFEFPGALSSWMSVPAEETDALQFAIDQAARRERG
jgi:hypothetical protein